MLSELFRQFIVIFFEVIYLLYLERFPFLFFLVPLPFVCFCKIS
mgnify:CR=1 FL=1